MRPPSPTIEYRPSDVALIDLLEQEAGRGGGAGLGVGELSRRLGVTATAVRQRLERLMRAGMVARTTMPNAVSTGISAAGKTGCGRSRGRPSHHYALTEKGRRAGGDNFRDLALVLWREIRAVREPAVRRGLISRVGAAMAGLYQDEVSGATPRERLESAAKILQERRISCAVVPPSDTVAAGLPVLTSYACPYPELAEQDRGICAAERLMLQDLVGSGVQLTDCRLDGAPCCRFTLVGDDAATTGSDARRSKATTCIARDL